MKRGDFSLFLASLILSLLLWLQVGAIFEPDKVHEVTVELERVGLPSTYIAVLPPESVTVSVRGPASAIARLRQDDVRASVDLSKVSQSGFTDARVRVSGPPDLGLSYTPKVSTVRISIDTEDLLPAVEVSILPLGDVARGVLFDLEKVKVLNGKVRVSGPSSMTEQVRKVVAKLNLAKVVPGEIVRVQVEAVGNDGEAVPGVRVDPPEVMIDPRAIVAPLSRTVLVNPTFDGAVAPGYEVESYQVIPENIEVKAKDAELLAEIQKLLTRPVNLRGMTNTTRQTVDLVVPNDVTAEPAKVEIVVKVVRSAGKAAPGNRQNPAPRGGQ